MSWGRPFHRLAVAAVSFVALIPFYILLLISLNPPGSDLSSELSLLPRMGFGNFVEAWHISRIGGAIFNSLVITSGTLVIVVLLASSAGYAIARFYGRLNRLIFYTFLAFMMIPGIINTVPLYTLMRAIRGINTRWAMILLCAANALPFSVFLYTGFIKASSREIEESAIIDGCSWFGAFRHVTFHLITPVTAAVVIINGVSVWNNYAQAVFFLQRREVKTIPLAISVFFQQYGAQWNLMAAAAVIGVLPAILTFIVFQKYFIKGIVSGALKG